MAVLQRSTRVSMPVEEAERCWSDFAAQYQDALGSGLSITHADPGTVFFTRVDENTTEITIQIDPEARAEDELEMNQSIESFLARFEGFIEDK